MFWLVIITTLAVATAYDDRECDKLMEAARACRDNYHNMTGDWEWSSIKSWTVKLINLDLDDDANLRETLCNMADSGIKTVEDLHKYLQQRMGPYRDSESGAKTAFAYSTFTSGLTERIQWLEYHINEIKTKLQFFGQTGFPDFPLGFTSEELAKMLNNYDDEVIGNMFWQIKDYDESNNWKPIYDMDKLANALAEAEDLDNFVELLNGYPSYSAYYDQSYEKPSEEDIEKKYETIQITDTFIQGMKRFGLWDLPRGDRKLSCGSVIDDTLKIITLLHQVFPREYNDAIEYLGLSYVFNHESRLRKWLCQVIESNSQTEMAKLFPNEQEVIDNYGRTSQQIMMQLATPEKYLFHANMAIVTLKALEEIDFPRFPLHITKDKAEEVAEKISNPRWDDEMKEKLARALQNAYSLTDFNENYDIPTRAAFQTIHDKLQGRMDEIEDFFFMVFRVLTEIEAGGFLMLPY